MPKGDVLGRAASGKRRASSLVRDSKVLRAAARLARGESSWITRCAWCERYRLGESWVDPELYALLGVDLLVTHGICERCYATLEAERRAAGA